MNQINQQRLSKLRSDLKKHTKRLGLTDPKTGEHIPAADLERAYQEANAGRDPEERLATSDVRPKLARRANKPSTVNVTETKVEFGKSPQSPVRPQKDYPPENKW